MMQLELRMMAALQPAEIEGEPWQGSAKLNVPGHRALPFYSNRNYNENDNIKTHCFLTVFSVNRHALISLQGT